MQVYIHTLEDLAWFVILLLSKFFNQFVHFLSLQEMIEKFNPYFLVMNIFLLCVYTNEPSHRGFYLLLLDPILLWKRILMSFNSILLDFPNMSPQCHVNNMYDMDKYGWSPLQIHASKLSIAYWTVFLYSNLLKQVTVGYMCKISLVVWRGYFSLDPVVRNPITSITNL